MNNLPGIGRSLGIVVLALRVTACGGGEDSPTSASTMTPTTTTAPATTSTTSTTTTTSVRPANLNGTWSGLVYSPAGGYHLTWEITHSGDRVSGPLYVTGLPGYTSGRGTGTVSGDQLRFDLSLAYVDCTFTAGGRATVTQTTMDGSYSGSDSCFGPVSNGTVALRRQ